MQKVHVCVHARSMCRHDVLAQRENLCLSMGMDFVLLPAFISVCVCVRAHMCAFVWACGRSHPARIRAGNFAGRGPIAHMHVSIPPHPMLIYFLIYLFNAHILDVQSCDGACTPPSLPPLLVC